MYNSYIVERSLTPFIGISMLKQLISVALSSFVAFASTSICVNAQAQELKMSTTLS